MEERRPFGLVAVQVLAVLGIVVILAGNILILAGGVQVRAGQVVLADVSDGDRVFLWVGTLPLSIVLVMALLRLIRVTSAVLAGDPFRPRTLLHVRQMAWLVGLGGFLGSLIAGQVAASVASEGADVINIRLEFGWVVAGLLIGLVAAIVEQGVRRSAPPAGPIGPVGPPPQPGLGPVGPPPQAASGPFGPPPSDAGTAGPPVR